ncbi:arylamine N-acetyltransferase family protein [Massilia consociata]|uniref:Arylamine N-acetyltransferase n=1 Tax=Massilia consociata TaxID=760117 RepID=A0ABV6FGC8_9BURK
MRIADYLARIGLHDTPRRDLATLAALQEAHMRTVPFENLDIHFGVPLVLDEAALYGKLVERRRGGVCYELNGLFAGLLRRLGYEVDMLSARVHGAGGSWSPEFDHLTLLVTLDGRRYLVDVGFGDAFARPLDIALDGTQDGGTGGFLVGRDGDDYVLARAGTPSVPMYRFGLQSRTLDEFGARCGFHQRSMESHFRSKRICSRMTDTGRVSLGGDELIFTENGTRRADALTSDDAIGPALREHFGIDLAWSSRIA